MGWRKEISPFLLCELHLKGKIATVTKIGRGIHPLARQAEGLLRAGKMDRREFLRVASLLGVSSGLSSAMVGIPIPAAAADSKLPFPESDPKAKRGGVLRAAMTVRELEDPAKFDSVEMENQARHTIETIALTGPDNITRPMLAERWSASNNLRTWEIRLRKGVMWHNGEELVADHIVWNVRRWLDPQLAAGDVTGLPTFSAMLSDDGAGAAAIPGAVEALNKYTVRFKLKRPVLSVMEDCARIQTAICHPSFRPPLTEDLIGTGPFAIAENFAGDSCILKRVTETHDGRPFIYWGGDVFLDEIHYYDAAPETSFSSYESGDVDFVHQIGRENIEAAKALEAQIHASQTGHTLVCRMQISKEPYADIRIREAVVRSVDNAAIKEKIFPVGGDVGENHHVAPIHPDYFKLRPLVRDVEKAKKLLSEAGFEDGLYLTIHVGESEGGWHEAVCNEMAAQMLEAGIVLIVERASSAEFQDRAVNAAFAAVPWPHEPLGTTTLSLAYRSAAPLNNTHFADARFDAALDGVESTLNMKNRRSRMQKIEKILQDNFLMVQPLCKPVYAVASKKIKGFVAHPTLSHHFNKVWFG